MFKFSDFGLSILMYHSIADNPSDLHATPVELFARQMLALSNQGYRVLDLLDALKGLSQWKNIYRTVVLTFDDAYLDFLTNAVPILKERGFSATVFAPTGLLGGTSVWDTYDKTKRLLDWDGLKEVERLGFRVGSHTVSHRHLPECDAFDLDYELRSSLDVLGQHLRDVVPVLSYPGGNYGRREVHAAKHAGYVASVGVSNVRCNYPWSDPYRLRRRRGSGK